MSTEEELKWMTKRYSWRYIPFRYQAMVATITAGFLYFNLFQILFARQTGSSGSCGSFLRPILSESADYGDGWFWHSLQDVFSNYAEASASNSVQTFCHSVWGTLWWQLLGTFAALAICGLVMRRAIKREEGIA